MRCFVSHIPQLNPAQYIYTHTYIFCGLVSTIDTQMLNETIICQTMLYEWKGTHLLSSLAFPLVFLHKLTLNTYLSETYGHNRTVLHVKHLRIWNLWYGQFLQANGTILPFFHFVSLNSLSFLKLRWENKVHLKGHLDQITRYCQKYSLFCLLKGLIWCCL